MPAELSVAVGERELREGCRGCFRGSGGPYREGDKEVSINEMMLAEGWCRMERDANTRLAAYPAILKSMRQFQQEAKEDRVGIYVYGDIGFETDESSVCFQNSATFSFDLEELP